MKELRKKTFKNGVVYCLQLEDGFLVETTDTFLPYYTKDAIGRHQNKLDNKRNWLIPYKNKMTIQELGQIRTQSNLKTTINLTLVDTSDFDAEKLGKWFDKEHFFVKLSPINPNNISEKNHLGNGVVEGVNLV